MNPMRLPALPIALVLLTTPQMLSGFTRPTCLPDGDLARTTGVYAEAIARLRDPDPVRRAEACRRLGRAGLEATMAAPALAALLGDADADVAVEAAEALGRIGGVLPLLTALKDKSAVVRANAARAFLYGARFRSAIPALIATLKHEAREVRYWAAYALDEFGPAAATAVPALTAALEDAKGNPSVAVRARIALSKIGVPCQEFGGLRTAARIDGWSGTDEVRLTLTYAWTQAGGESSWIIRPNVTLQARFWDSEGYAVESDGLTVSVEIGEGLLARRRSSIQVPIAVVVPKGAATVSVPFGAIEMSRLVLPVRCVK
jgi:hypothetical protein